MLTSLGTGSQLGANFLTNENHFPPLDTQPYSYRESLVNESSIDQENVHLDQVSNIPVRTARSALSDVDYFFHVNDSANVGGDDDGDFVQYVKKKPRRYYLGGFLPLITEDKIARYVTSVAPLSRSFVSGKVNAISGM